VLRTARNLLKVLVVLLARGYPAAGILYCLVRDSSGQASTAADQQIRGTAVEMLKKKGAGISTQREHAKPRPQNAECCERHRCSASQRCTMISFHACA